MNLKEALSLFSIILTFVAFYPYVMGILKGLTKPHLFSWVIWALTTLVVFFAQLEAEGGAGAWPTGVSGIITLGIAVMAYLKRADLAITRLDWICFFLALSSLPLWYVTSDPTWAVIILTAVDLLGFVPTLRKLKAEAGSESAMFYGLFGVRNLISLFALESLSIATVLFPLAIGLACFLVVALIAVQGRHTMRKQGF